MYDYKINIISGSISLSLYKRGVEKLEETRDEYGTSYLTKLLFIIESFPSQSGSLADIKGISEEAEKIIDTYTSVYFPN